MDENPDEPGGYRAQFGGEGVWQRIGRLDEAVMSYVRLQLREGHLDELLKANAALQEISGRRPDVFSYPRTAMENRARAAGDAAVATPEVMRVVRAAVPQLANEIAASPTDAAAYLNVLAALLQLVTALVTLYQLTHQQSPTPTQITQVFDNSIHQTVVVHPPPAPPPAGPPE